MTEHTIRIHQPFSLPKSWVVEAFDDRGWSFTEDHLDAGKFTSERALEIVKQLSEDNPNAVIVMDGL